MTRIRLRHTLAQIVRGYSRSLKTLAWTLVLGCVALAASTAVVFPLWYFATHERKAYSIVVLSLFAGGLLYLGFRKTRAFWELPVDERLRRMRRLALKSLAVFGYLVALYVILGFYLVGSIGLAVPLTVAYLLALGYTLYARKSGGRR